MVHPAEGNGSISDALTESDQESPGRFILQQDAGSVPAHEPHDGSKIREKHRWTWMPL